MIGKYTNLVEQEGIMQKMEYIQLLKSMRHSKNSARRNMKRKNPVS